MLNYYYKKPVGYVTLTQIQGDKKVKFQIQLLRGNCMWVEMYFYKHEGTEYEQLNGFFNDAKHLKNFLKDNNLDDYNNYVFYSKNFEGYEEEIWKAIRILVANGKKVTIK